MNLLLLTFGENIHHHQQAIFSILGFLRDPCIGRVLVVTDRPECYLWLLSSSPLSAIVEVMSVSPEQLRGWQGPWQFFWRVKIEAVALAVRRYPGQHLLYVDSDTFLATSLAGMRNQLDTGTAFMHCLEDRLGDRHNRTLIRMCQSLAGQTVAGITLSEQHAMWNAGVIALPATKAAALVALTRRLCDDMCDTDCPRRLIEQFAFSVALQQAGALLPCDQDIAHYWGNKDGWNVMIASFLAESRIRNESVAQAMARVAALDWQKLPLEYREHGMAISAKRWLEALFRPKKLRFFKPG